MAANPGTRDPAQAAAGVRRVGPVAAAAPHCRHCHGTLDALDARLGKVCRRSSCLAAEDRATLAARQQAELTRRRSAAARKWGDPAPPTNCTDGTDGTDRTDRIVWLEPHAVRLKALSAGERRDHLEHLAALAAGAEVDGGPALAEPAAAAAEAAALPSDAADIARGDALADAVCAFCAGRCCRFGAERHGFVDRALLDRWVESHPGRSVGDAAAAYAALLPPRHVAGSCVHHGAAGCVLPRALRSDICNRHVCEPLATLQRERPEAAVVAMGARGRVLRAVRVAAGGSRPLPRDPRR